MNSSTYDNAAAVIASPAPGILRLFPQGGQLRGQQWLDLADLARQAPSPFLYLGPLGSIEIHEVDNLDTFQSALFELELAQHLAWGPVLADPLDKDALEHARIIARCLHASTTIHPALFVGSLADAAPAEAEVEAALQHWQQVLAADTDVNEQRVSLVHADVREEFEVESAPANLAPIGWLEEHLPAGRVALGAGVVDQRLHVDYAEMLGRMDIDVVLTSHRTLCIPDIADGDAEVVIRFLAPRGFIFDAASPLL